MIDYILNDGVKELLIKLEAVLRKIGIDFYIVGAVARDIQLSVDPALAPHRKTKDVDIAIMIADEKQYYEVKRELLATEGFTAHETKAIKFFYKQSIELDLLPFGDIENEDRETRIHKPRLFVMDMPGFLEVLPVAKEIELVEGTNLKVCSLEGLVLLKLIAYSDDSQRTKDLTDIDHIISVYFDLDPDLIYDNYMDLLDQYDPNNPIYLQLISARIIGIKIGHLLKDSLPLNERVLNIINKRPLETWQAMATGVENA